MSPINIDQDPITNFIRDILKINLDIFKINADVANSVSYLNSSELELVLFPIKIIFGLISLAIIGATVYFLFKTTWFKQIFFQDAVEFFTYKPYGVGTVTKSWKKIMAH